MGGIWALVRIDIGRRWGSLLVLSLLVALSTGTVLAAATAAHRGATALGRLEAASRPATVQVPNFDARVDLGVLARLPYVEAVARTSAGGIGVLDDGRHGSTEQNTPVDDVLFTGLERPVIVAGRLFDPAAPDEAVVTPAWARTTHRGVGDTAVVRLPTPLEQATGEGNDVPQGPAVTVRIVGIVTTPAYLDWPGQPGWFIPSPGLADHYRRNWDTSVTNPSCGCQWASVGAMVRLAHGADDIARLRTDLARLFPGHTFNVLNLDQQLQIHQHDILVQSAGLLAFAVAALVAAIVILAQATGRHVSASRSLLRTAAALGHTPRSLQVAAAAGPVLAAAAGAAAGVAAAVVSSHWTPIGIARVVEPRPGVAVDPLVLGLGVVAAVALVGGTAALAAHLAMTGRGQAGSGRHSRVAAWVSRSRLSVPMQLGTRFALEPGRAGRSLPVAQTLTAVVIAIAGTSAALMVNSGVRDALAHPVRYGQTYQSASFVGFGGTDFLDEHAIAGALSGIDYVTGVGMPRQSSATAEQGRVGVPLFSRSDDPEPLPVVVLAGRMPSGPAEVALAPATLRALGADVGDTVQLGGDRGAASLRIVGRVLMPLTNLTRYDEGGWVTDAGYDRLFSGFDAHWVLVATDPTAGSGQALYHRLTHDAARTLGPAWAQTAGFNAMGVDGLTTQPLRQVRWFPGGLGLLVALLAIAAVAHAGAIAVRRRAGDLAGMRALGMTPGGTALALITQGLAVGVLGLAIGLPLGAAVGRSVWRVIASGVPLQLVSPSLDHLWPVAPAVLGLALLLSSVPAVRAARLPVADALRAE